MKNFTKFISNHDQTIHRVVNHIKKNKTTFVLISKEKKIIGTFTLGDFKKILYKGINLKNKISTVISKNFFYVDKKYNHNQLKKIFNKKALDFIPVLDQGKLVDIILKKDLFKFYNTSQSEKNKNKIGVVIMAGGLGKRLKPISTILPKALMPFPDKPIIYEIINNFLNHGYKNLYITLNYKADLIKSYLSQFSNFKINYIMEDAPMGTCGALSNKKLLKYKHLMVANCDTLIKSNYDAILSDHLSYKNDMTIVTTEKEHVTDYGVCDLNEDGKLASIIEKPRLNFLINTGFYILDSRVLTMIKKKRKYDMDKFINLLLKSKKNISTSTILEKEFIDIGQWKFYLDYFKNFK